jgi:hypothetical protein
MSASSLERLMARLYTDERLRRFFVENPVAVAQSFGVPPEMLREPGRIDVPGLMLAGRSFAAKRKSKRDLAASHDLPRGLAAFAGDIAGRSRVLLWRLSRSVRR